MQKAFTLVELLVVIGIIATLLAILFPVLQASRKQSYQSTCINNLRQIGQAVKLYEQDFEELPLHATNLWDSSYISSGEILVCKSDVGSNWGTRVTENQRHPGGDEYLWPASLKKSSYIYVKDFLSGIWQDPFNKINGDNPNPGIFVCQTHGEETQKKYTEARMDEDSTVVGWEYSGTIVRLNLDGSVVTRQYTPHIVHDSETSSHFEPSRWYLFMDLPSKCKACDGGF